MSLIIIVNKNKNDLQDVKFNRLNVCYRIGVCLVGHKTNLQ